MRNNMKKNQAQCRCCFYINKFITRYNMRKNNEKIIDAFKNTTGKWIQATRKGNTAIGKTLEDYFEIEENNIDAPDLAGFEIKSQRELAKSRITLFTKAPTNPKNANTLLRQRFGKTDDNDPNLKILHTTISHQKYNTHASGYNFTLQCNDNDEKIYLKVQENSTKKIISENVYWSYSVIDKIIKNKIQHLAFVEAEVKKENNVEFFNYRRMTLFSGLNLKQFLKFIRKSDGIVIDIRLGSYKSGKKYGKTHDHGTGFRIDRNQLESLYKKKFIVE